MAVLALPPKLAVVCRVWCTAWKGLLGTACASALFIDGVRFEQQHL
jgi:hypothetical protein